MQFRSLHYRCSFLSCKGMVLICTWDSNCLSVKVWDNVWCIFQSINPSCFDTFLYYLTVHVLLRLVIHTFSLVCPYIFNWSKFHLTGYPQNCWPHILKQYSVNFCVIFLLQWAFLWFYEWSTSFICMFMYEL